MSEADFFQQLRQHTSALHSDLESCYPFNTIMCPDRFNTASYTDTLRVMHGFHCKLAKLPLEHYQMNLTPFLQADQVCEDLAADLADLAQQGERTEALPFEVPLLPDENPHNLDQLIASAYVWIGSSMGAKIISRWLAQSHSDLPSRYYERMKLVGNGWADFKRSVGDSECAFLDVSKTGNYACALFQSLIHSSRHLSSPGQISH